MLARVYRTVSSLGATSPLVKAAQARLARPLPPKADVERSPERERGGKHSR